MYESAQQWDLVGPDGTTVSFNAGGSLYLEEVSGFDSPNVRQNLEDIPEGDGALAGDFFYSSRPVTLRGRIAAATASARNAQVVSMQRALRALRGDVTLKSQASGLPAMQAYARLENVRVTGGYVKEFLISLVCADPLIYSQTETTGTATGGAGTTGATFPWAFPVDFGGGSGATLAVAVTQAGNIDAPAKIRVYGPAIDPAVRNSTTDEWLYLDGITLASGEWVEVDTRARTAVRNDGSSVYDRVRFPGSVWWRLVPGSNTVQLWATGTTGATVLEIRWRDAWA